PPIRPPTKAFPGGGSRSSRARLYSPSSLARSRRRALRGILTRRLGGIKDAVPKPSRALRGEAASRSFGSQKTRASARVIGGRQDDPNSQRFVSRACG